MLMSTSLCGVMGLPITPILIHNLIVVNALRLVVRQRGGMTTRALPRTMSFVVTIQWRPRVQQKCQLRQYQLITQQQCQPWCQLLSHRARQRTPPPGFQLKCQVIIQQLFQLYRRQKFHPVIILRILLILQFLQVLFRQMLQPSIPLVNRLRIQREHQLFLTHHFPH